MSGNSAAVQAKGLTHLTAFSYEDLISCAKGRLFGPGNAQLPMPPMLMERPARINCPQGCDVCGVQVGALFSIFIRP